MNIQRFAAAVVAVYLVLWALAIGLFDYALAAQLVGLKAVFRPEVEMNQLVIWTAGGHFLQVLVFCYIFLKGYEQKGVMEGVRYGLLIGLLFATTDLTWRAGLPIDTGTTIAWALADLIMWTVGGAVLAAIYRPADDQAVADG